MNKANKEPRQRDAKGRFIAGNTAGKRGARGKGKAVELRERCQRYGIEGIDILYKMLKDEDTADGNKIKIWELFMSYGFGKPYSDLDAERLSIDRERLKLEQERARGDGDKAIKIVLDEKVKELAE